MHILLEIDFSLYLLLFIVAGTSGLLVRIDQWVEGDYNHPQNNHGKLDVWRSFWSYILTFTLSGLAGVMVSIGSGYFFENHDSNILLFIAIMVGAIGKLIFYKLVEWVHTKIDDNVYSKKEVSSRSTRRRGKK